MNKLIKALLWIIGIIVVLLCIIMALSPVATKVINEHGEEIIGRQTSVNRVFINPFFGTVTVDSFVCKEQNGVTNFVVCKRLYVQMAWSELIVKRINLRRIYLDGFSGEILQGDTTFNFTDIINRFSTPNDTTDNSSPSKWKVKLSDIRIQNSALTYHDMVRNNEWSIDDINLRIPGLYFDNQQTDAGLSFSLPLGGKVDVNAGYKMESRRYAIKLHLDSVNADIALPLVQDYLDITGLGARVTGDVRIDGGLSNIRDIVLSGKLTMCGLSVRDKNKDEVASMDKMRVVIRRGDVLTNYYQLDTLVLSGLSGHFERYKDENTLSCILRKNTNDSTAEAKQEETMKIEQSVPEHSIPLTWRANAVLFTGNHFTFDDYTLNDDFHYEIDSIRMDGRNIASGAQNKIQLRVLLQGNGAISANYIGGFNLKKGEHAITFKMTGVSLQDFSPYTESLMAYPIENGDLAIESHINLSDGQMSGENRIVMDQVQVGKKKRFSKAPYKSIPLRAGVNLLKSAQGLIVLDVPIQGDISSPKFKLGKVVGRAIAKVFFGPMMGLKDKDKRIVPEGLSDRDMPTEESWKEMESWIGDSTLNVDTIATATE